MAVSTDLRYVANATIVFREEFDDFAILYDPDTGNGFGINPVGVFIWKRLDGKRTVADLVAEVKNSCAGVPGTVEQEVVDFVHELEAQGMAGTAV
jgi:SynChlorMet cassette protein ScmD